MDATLAGLVRDRARSRCEYCRLPAALSAIPFEIEWDGAALRAKTAIGRATIEVLAINAPDAIAVREALIEEGVFPIAR